MTRWVNTKEEHAQKIILLAAIWDRQMRGLGAILVFVFQVYTYPIKCSIFRT